MIHTLALALEWSKQPKRLLQRLQALFFPNTLKILSIYTKASINVLIKVYEYIKIHAESH